MEEETGQIYAIPHMDSLPHSRASSRLLLSVIELTEENTDIYGCPSKLFVSAVENGHYDVATQAINTESHIGLADCEQSQDRNKRLLACLGRVLIHHRENVFDFILSLETIEGSHLVTASQLFIHHEKDESLRFNNEQTPINMDLFGKMVVHSKMNAEGIDVIFKTAVERELVSVISFLLDHRPTLTRQAMKKLMQMYRYAIVREDPETHEIIRIIRVLLENGKTEEGVTIYQGWDEMSQELRNRKIHTSAIKVYQNHSPDNISLTIEGDDDQKAYVMALQKPNSSGKNLWTRFVQGYTPEQAMSDGLVFFASVVAFQLIKWFKN